MPANELQYWDYNKSLSERPDDFGKYGHPGKWFKAIEYGASETLNFTGSNIGAGAIVMGDNTNTLIHLSNGGIVSGSYFATNTIHELSISKIETGLSATGYVLIRNQMIR